MKISVALASYNGEAYLAEQLASIAGQTRRPDELIVSDDGSTDRTLEIVRRFGETAPFKVTVVAKPSRLGFADNFLHAAAHCSYDLIAFCDQDDVWLPNKLELGASRIIGDDSSLSMHRLTVTDQHLRPTGFEWDQGILSDSVHEPLELDPFYTGWGNTMLFRRELLEVVPADKRPRQPFSPDRLISHDTWIYILAASLGRVSWITDPLILYRQHSNTATTATKPKRRRSLSSFVSVPIVEMRERASLYDQIVSLFEDRAKAGGPLAMSVSAAAKRYSERRHWWSTRAKIFDDPTMAARGHSYSEFHHLTNAQRHGIPSKLKDIVLGISGITRARHHRSKD